LTAGERLAQLLGDRTHIEAEEKLYEVYNANSQFSCVYPNCNLCKEGAFISQDVQKGLKTIPERLLEHIKVSK
jgi:hypothetical protein